MNEGEIRQECDNCMVKGPCTPECFNAHPGSIRALMKSFNVDVVDETGNRYLKIATSKSGEYVKVHRGKR
jgi:hypothetical protein